MTTVERLDEILKKHKMSRRQLAIAANIPPSSLQSAMERNKPLSFEMYEKISKTLEMSILNILGDDERELFIEAFVEAESGMANDYLKQGYKFTNDERTLVRLFHSLTEQGQHRGLETMWELSQVPLYQRPTSPESSLPPQEGTDTTRPQNPPETPPEGE